MSDEPAKPSMQKLGKTIINLTAFKGNKGLNKMKEHANIGDVENHDNNENQDFANQKKEKELQKDHGAIQRFGVKKRLTVRNEIPLTLQEKKDKKKIEGKRDLHINDYVKKDPHDDSERLINLMSLYLCNNSTFKTTVYITTFIQMICIVLKLSCNEKLYESITYDTSLYSWKNAETDHESYMAFYTYVKIFHYYLKPIAASIYLIDFGLNVYTGGDMFLSSFFLTFDALCCAPIIISQYFQYDGFVDLEWLIILRSVRFVLSFILTLSDKCDAQPELRKKFYIRHLVEMKLSIDTFRKSVHEVLLTILLLGIILLVFSIMAVEMCGRYSPNFSTTFDCLFSFWTAVTMDGWVDVIDTTQSITQPVDYQDYFNYTDRQLAGFFAGLILITVILVGGFIFNNLFVALVTASLDEVVQEQKDKQIYNELGEVHQMFVQNDPKKNPNNPNSPNYDPTAAANAGVPGEQKFNADGTPVAVKYDKDGNIIPQNDQANSSEFTPILPFKEIQECYFPRAQLPIFNNQMGYTTIDKCEEYATLMHALEKNLNRYKKLRISLNKVYEQVHDLNIKDFDEKDAKRIEGLKTDAKEKAIEDQQNNQMPEVGAYQHYD